MLKSYPVLLRIEIEIEAEKKRKKMKKNRNGRLSRMRFKEKVG